MRDSVHLEGWAAFPVVVALGIGAIFMIFGGLAGVGCVACWFLDKILMYFRVKKALLYFAYARARYKGQSPVELLATNKMLSDEKQQLVLDLHASQREVVELREKIEGLEVAMEDDDALAGESLDTFRFQIGEIERLKKELEEAEREVSDANGVMDNIDTTVANALESLGLDTCVGHGFPCRVDALIAAAKESADHVGKLKDVLRGLWLKVFSLCDDYTVAGDDRAELLDICSRATSILRHTKKD